MGELEGGDVSTGGNVVLVAVGLLDAVSVGLELDVTDGVLEATTVGTELDETVGLLDAATIGAEEGSSEDESTGDAVGASVVVVPF